MFEKPRKFWDRDRGPDSVTASVIRLALAASEALDTYNNRAADERGEPFDPYVECSGREAFQPF